MIFFPKKFIWQFCLQNGGYFIYRHSNAGTVMTTAKANPNIYS